MTASKLKNYWPSGDGYQGINYIFATPCDAVPITGKLKFELQFHTPESFAFKSKGHKLYEIYRAAKDPVAKAAAFNEQAAQARAVPVPEGVLDLPKPKSVTMPSERAMFAELALSRAMALQDRAAAAVGACVGKPADELITMLMPPSAIEKSLSRLVADADGDDTVIETLDSETAPLKEVVNRLPNVMTIVVLLPDQKNATYAKAAAAAAEAITKASGIQVLELANMWKGPLAAAQLPRWAFSKGVLLRCAMDGEDDGVAYTNDQTVQFTVALHTPASFQVAMMMRDVWAALDCGASLAARKAYAAKKQEAEAGLKVPEGAAGIGSSLLLHT
jgi:hypothetical protein